MSTQTRRGDRLAASIRAAVGFGRGYPQTRTAAEIEERAERAREKALEQGGAIRCPSCGRR